MKNGKILLVCLLAVITAGACKTAAPAKTSTAPALPPKTSSAPQPAEAAKPASIAGDYYGPNIKLAGIGDRVGGPYTVNFYTAEVVTPPSPATKNEGLVRPTGRVEGSSEKEFWTPYIASSRPATKEDLKPGVIVFAAGDAQPRSREELAKIQRWELFRVKDVSNLFKGIVVVTFQSTYGGTHWRDREYHVNNLRVLTSDLPLQLAELPK